jgi:peptidoglycan/xylan/chitin deacetylase (PgdA/CDA1 family)
MVMKTVLWALARSLGAKRLLDRVFGIEPIVLMYHRFSEQPQAGFVHRAALERQLEFLHEHCNVISVAELNEGLRSKRRWDGRTPIAITIDDGYADVYEILYPLLRKFDLPATLFATSSFIDGCLWYWQDKLRYVLQETAARTLVPSFRADQQPISLHTEADRELAWHTLADHCHVLTVQEREQVIRDVAEKLRVEIPYSPPSEFRALTWSQLREMSRYRVDVGGHTMSHPRLSALTPEQAFAEVVGCKTSIEAALGQPSRFFAYPFGFATDCNEAAETAVSRAGFELAFVSYFDRRLYDNRMAVRRFGVGTGYWDFLKVVNGLKRANCIRKGSMAEMPGG